MSTTDTRPAARPQKRKPYLVGSLVSDPHQIYAKLRSYKLRMLDKHKGVMCVFSSLSSSSSSSSSSLSSSI